MTLDRDRLISCPAAVGEELLNCMMRTSNGLEIQFQFLYCAKFLTHAKIKCMEL